MNPHYTYLMVDVGALLIPFLASFHPRLRFYKRWPYLWLPLLLTAGVFIAWDALFTRMGIWAFNPAFTLPCRILSLPVEEWLFFFCIPYACVFVYAALLPFFRNRNTRWGWPLSLLLAGILILTALIFRHRAYSFTSFGGCGLGLMLAWLVRRRNPNFQMAPFLLSYTVCLLPFFIVNGILTALPVVSYNDAENLGIRLYTIPVEDVFYGLLMVMGSVWGMEAMTPRTEVAQA